MVRYWVQKLNRLYCYAEKYVWLYRRRIFYRLQWHCTLIKTAAKKRKQCVEHFSNILTSWHFVNLNHKHYLHQVFFTIVHTINIIVDILQYTCHRNIGSKTLNIYWSSTRNYCVKNSPVTGKKYFKYINRD